MSGLTPTGFIAPTVQETVADVNTSLLTSIDQALDLSPQQPMGQIVGIFSEKIGEIWELMSTVYNQMDPDAAEGNLLDGLCALTGSRRQTATFSTAVGQLNLNASTTVSAGSIVYVTGQPNNTWVLQADVTSTTPGSYNGTFRSSLPGPFVANAGTLTGIATPVVGWNSVTNAADAIQGVNEDTDAILRIKRENELAAAGSGDVDAIRAALLEVPGVIQAFVFENTTLITDTTGLPGKAFRAVIWDGSSPAASNNAIAQVIWNAKPSGIQAYGATASGNATDSLGNTRVVPFDRAAQIPIYVTLTTTLGTNAPSNYRTLVKAALVAYAKATWNLGVEVFALALRSQALTVLGVEDVPTFFLDITPSPAATANIPISGLQIATLSTANILVDGA